MDLSDFPILDNILEGLIGAAIASAAIWLFRRIRDYRLERKYSLNGVYKGEYEDIIDGKKAIEKERVTLKQRGLNFEAAAANAKTGRGWGFEGEIDDKTGYIYGYYKAQSITDSSLGVFVFDQKPDGKLEGMWAGYDSQNKNISHGRYILTKFLPVHVRRGAAKDAPAIFHIAAKALGEGYLNHDTLMKALERDHVFVAEYEGTIIGYAISEIIRRGEFEVHLKGQTYRIPAYMDHADKTETLGLLRTVAVDSDYQKKGAGTRLVEAALEALKKAGATHIVSFAWRTDTAHIGPLLEAKGFQEKAVFDDFWHQESLDHDYLCPHCGHPCHCTAILYSRAA